MLGEPGGENGGQSWGTISRKRKPSMSPYASSVLTLERMSKPEKKELHIKGDEMYRTGLTDGPEILLSVEEPKENSIYESVMGEACGIGGYYWYANGCYRKKQLSGLK